MHIRRLSSTAALSALYALTTLLTAPLSYGVVQFRIAEVLCLLPYFFPGSVWGLFFGCALANLLSGSLADLLFGSLATLLSALAVRACGRRGRSPVLACLYITLINALIVGAVLSIAYESIDIRAQPGVFVFNALSVGMGEALVLFLLGLPLLRALPGHRLFPFLSSHFDCTRERV